MMIPAQFWRINILHRDLLGHLPQIARSLLTTPLPATAISDATDPPSKVITARSPTTTSTASPRGWRSRPHFLLMIIVGRDCPRGFVRIVHYGRASVGLWWLQWRLH